MTPVRRYASSFDDAVASFGYVSATHRNHSLQVDLHQRVPAVQATCYHLLNPTCRSTPRGTSSVSCSSRTGSRSSRPCSCPTAHRHQQILPSQEGSSARSPPRTAATTTSRSGSTEKAGSATTGDTDCDPKSGDARREGAELAELAELAEGWGESRTKQIHSPKTCTQTARPSQRQAPAPFGAGSAGRSTSAFAASERRINYTSSDMRSRSSDI